MKILFLMVCFLFSASSFAVNKCAAPGGGFVFQDMPCTGKGEAVSVRPGSGHADAKTDEAVVKSKKFVADVNWRSKVQEAISLGVPLVGMTRVELNQAMGAPTKVNADNYSGVLRDQIIYRQSSQTWYVYTEGGVVTSIQHSPENNKAEAVDSLGRKLVCPSPYEIRDMETSASSIRLSEAERVERLKQIGEARKCGR